METELVKMSPKGQLVVPQDIRETEGFAEGDRFIPFPVKGGVLFKKVKIPDAKAEFEKLAKDIQKRFKELNISQSDVQEAVAWARKK